MSVQAASTRAAIVRGMDPKLRCAECGRGPREDENADDEWRAGSDGVGELHVFYPECWEREFGENAARPLRSRGFEPNRDLDASRNRHAFQGGCPE